MARIDNLTNFLTDVASAIKQKTGDSTNIPAVNFDSQILNIQTVGNYQSKSLNITNNGDYTFSPDSGYDALSYVNISVNVAGINTYDATATSSDILLGKTAYANGVKITGIYEEVLTMAEYDQCMNLVTNILG